MSLISAFVVGLTLVGFPYSVTSLQEARLQNCELFHRSFIEMFSNGFATLTELISSFLEKPLNTLIDPNSLEVKASYVPIKTCSFYGICKKDYIEDKCAKLKKKFDMGNLMQITALALYAIGHPRGR